MEVSVLKKKLTRFEQVRKEVYKLADDFRDDNFEKIIADLSFKISETKLNIDALKGQMDLFGG